jgi:hypothetical protein
MSIINSYFEDRILTQMCEETVPVMLCLMGDEDTLKDASEKYSQIESATESEKKLVRKLV